jgi:hypothetical protein
MQRILAPRQRRSIMRKTGAFLIMLASLLALPAPAEAVRKPAIGPATKKQFLAQQKVDLKQNLKTAKDTVKRGKPYLAAQMKTVKALARAERNAGYALGAAALRYNAAEQANLKNPTAANLGRLQVAQADRQVKDTAYRAAKGELDKGLLEKGRLETKRDEALSALKAATKAQKLGPRLPSAPLAIPQARLANARPPAGFMVVQAPSLAGVYGPAPPQMQRTNNYGSGAGLGPADQRFVSTASIASQLPDAPRPPAVAVPPAGAANAAPPQQRRIQQNHFQLPPPPPNAGQ